MNNITQRIKIQNLYELVANKKKVTPYALIDESEKLYRFVKAVGIKNVSVYYINESGEETFLKGPEIPRRIRAVSILIMKMLNRWDDQHHRLERHYDLDCPVNLILDDIGLFRINDLSLECISVQDIIDKIAM